MELEILKLVYDYSINGKLVDSKYIDKIIETVVVKQSLNDYVQNFRFTNDLEKDENGIVCATYSPINKEIVLDYESVQLIIENRSYYDYLFSDFEQVMYRNLSITQFILHELEHAYQNKQLDEKQDNSIEKKLINACFMLEYAMKNQKFISAIISGEIPIQDFMLYVLQNRELYKQYYKFNPVERLAQTNSFQTIISSIEPIKEYIPNLYELENASLVEEGLKGYQESWEHGTCPTEVYLLGTRQGKVWNEFDFYDGDSSKLMKKVNDKFELSKRLKLGLPISYNEYNRTDEWLHSTNKYN